MDSSFLRQSGSREQRLTPLLFMAAALLPLLSAVPSAKGIGAIDGLSETVVPKEREGEVTQGLVLFGSATWPTSDLDFLRRSGDALPLLATAGFWHFPKTDFERPERTGGGRLGVSEFLAESPLYYRRLGGSAAIAFRVNYELTLMDSGVPGLGDGLELHRMELPVSFSWQPKHSEWFGFVRTSVFGKTDFDASWSEAVGYSALAGAFRRVTDSLAVGLGAYYDYSLGDHRFVGGPGFLWAPTKNFSSGLIGPALNANWRFAEQWRLRMEGRWRSQDWVLGDTALGGADTQLELRNLRALAAIERKIFQPFDTEAWLSLQVGYRFMTRLEVRDSDRRDLFREDLDDNLFFGVAIRMQL